MEVVGYPHSGCLPRGRAGAAPLITSWYNTIMVQSGDTVRLACQVSVREVIGYKLFTIMVQSGDTVRLACQVSVREFKWVQTV